MEFQLGVWDGAVVRFSYYVVVDMHRVVSEKPYKFVPPSRGKFWPAILKYYLPRNLRTQWGVEQVECRGAERLKASLDAGHGILLAPNHSRHSDPFVLGTLGRKSNTFFYLMASWHLFMDGGLQAWLIRRMGAFSVYREGMDKAAISYAINVLASAERPLVIFPEGVVSRANDHLNALLEGTTFIARSAAKKRAKQSPAGKVVIHPVVIKYHFDGDVESTVNPILDEIEQRLTWQPREQSLVERIVQVGEAILTLKELEHLGRPQSGHLHERIEKLIDHLLIPLEQQWLAEAGESTTLKRVKRLRSAILPELVEGDLDESEKARRWQQLSVCYLAQQLAWYPPDYVRSNPTPERILETVERFEDDLTDQTKVHRPLRAIIHVDEAIEVEPKRERGTSDPLLDQLESRLRSMIDNPAS